MDAYVDWKEQSVAVRDTYSRWGDARRADARAAYLAYVTALDREARASEAYADTMRRVEPAPPPADWRLDPRPHTRHADERTDLALE
jgi:hypothetical protein